MNPLEQAVHRANDVSLPVFESDDTTGTDIAIAVQIPINEWLGVLVLLLPDAVERV